MPIEDRMCGLHIFDPNGNLIFALVGPAKKVKSTVIACDSRVAEIGRIVLRNVDIVGKTRFRLCGNRTAIPRWLFQLAAYGAETRGRGGSMKQRAHLALFHGPCP